MGTILQVFFCVWPKLSFFGPTIVQGMKLDLRTQGGGHTVVHEFAIKMHFAPDKISQLSMNF